MTRSHLRLGVATCLLACLSPSLVDAQATMTRARRITPTGAFIHTFQLEVTGPAIPDIGWLIFADTPGFGNPPHDAAELTGPFTGLPHMLGPVPGPWTRLSSSTSEHNGPTFAPAFDHWVPMAVGERLHWQVRATNDVPCDGAMYWSNLSGAMPRAIFELIACGPVCGDGEANGSEVCDDGNTWDADGCNADCMSTDYCGDGMVKDGEECDDGNADNTDACLDTCVVASCGDGFAHADIEECDDGNADNTDACLDTCMMATCGDGLVRVGVEECDDANDDDTDTCPTSCAHAVCGDGLVQTGVEDCDDGNAADGDGCSATCEVEALVEDAGTARPDAGLAGPDASLAGPDAGLAGPDAGGAPPAERGDDGCGCRVMAPGQPSLVPHLLALSVLLVSLRRRASWSRRRSDEGGGSARRARPRDTA